jgi:cytochrome P450
MGDDTQPAGIYQPHTPQLQRSLYEIYREMRDQQPIYRDPRHVFYVATRYDDVASILQDAETYSNAGVEESKLLMPMIVYMDGERHKSLRMLLSRVFTPKRVADLEPKIRASTQRLLDESAKQPRCDFMRSFASQLPSIVICDLIGIPDARRQAFLSYTEAMIETGPESHPIEEPAAKIYAEFESLLAERGREPRDDLMSALLAADVDGHGLSHRELLGFCFNLIIGGTDTTMNLIGNGTVALAREPEQRRALRDEPAKIPDAIEEMLRFESPTQTLPRRPTRDVELHGVTRSPRRAACSSATARQTTTSAPSKNPKGSISPCNARVTWPLAWAPITVWEPHSRDSRDASRSKSCWDDIRITSCMTTAVG